MAQDRNPEPERAGETAAPARFEDALSELEGIVTRLEAPDVPLETSLALFENGMRLSRLLEQKLDEAERKIEILVKGRGGELEREPFRPGSDDEQGR